MSTIYDVAQRAGVSHTAVSAVINGNKKSRVGPEKQRKILEAIQELGYKPSRVAQQLRTGVSNTIGVCFANPYKHVFVHWVNGVIISAIGDTFSEHGYDVLIKSTSKGTSIQQPIEDLPSRGVDGIIVIGAIQISKQAVSAIDGCDIPLVCIDGYQGFAKASTVDTDNAGAATRGTAHLISQGHRRITYIGQPPLIQCFTDRIRGFCEALQEHDIPVDMNSVRTLAKEHAFSLLEEILQQQNRPTALVCGEGYYADAAAEAIVACGLRVPDDIALLAFDSPPQKGIDPEHVSVIRTSSYDMGTAAAELLKKLIDGEVSGPVNIRVPAQFDLKPSNSSN